VIIAQDGFVVPSSAECEKKFPLVRNQSLIHQIRSGAWHIR